MIPIRNYITALAVFITFSGKSQSMESAIQNIKISDVGGKLLSMGATGVEGTPYFLDKFMTGRIIFPDGMIMNDTSLNFSFVDNHLYFISNNNLYQINKTVNEFYLEQKDEANGVITHHFISGLPAAESLTNASFYELLSAGKNIELLKHIGKQIKETSVYGGAPIKEYSSTKNYFLFYPRENKMLLIGDRLNIKSLKKVLLNEALILDSLIGSKQLNVKNESDLIRLLSLLNEQLSKEGKK